ncbi:MAG: fibronectin type III domain-containing protein [Solirubrobacteraceae bacterium]
MGVRSLGLVRAILVSLCVSFCVFGIASASASAAAPVVEAQSFSNVGSSSASLSAKVNPGGSPTSYRFEYGTSEAYGSTTPSRSIGGGSEGISVSVPLEELQPHTLYHFRVIAANELGETTNGSDTTFTTLSVGLLGLPDQRVYEMVTPVENNDSEAYVSYANVGNEENGIFTDLPFEAAADGNAVTFAGGPTPEGTGSSGDGEGNEFLARRSPSGGWTQTNIQPHKMLYAAYQAFSSDLSTGVFDIYSEPGVRGGNSSERSEVLYEGEVEGGGEKTLSPASPQPGRMLYTFGVNNGQNLSQVIDYAGASQGMSHVLFEANDALTANAVDGGEEANNLYDSNSGKLYLVNVLPDGSSQPNATFGGSADNLERPGRPAGTGTSGPDFNHVISSDGSRIFWTDQNTGDLYVRENDTQPQSPIENGRCAVATDACTVQIDGSQASGKGGGGRFWAASSDGSKVFFTDSDAAGLTSDTVSGSGQNLYEYELPSGRLVDLTPSADASTEGVVAASEDGEYIYFVATGDLAAGAELNESNLYLYHDGTTTFIAKLEQADGWDMTPWSPSNGGETGDWQPNVGHRTAEATPDGTTLVFMSHASLTGYDNRYGNTAYPEVYLYEAEHNHLTCVSCSKSGEAVSYSSESEVAGFLPISFSNTYQQRWISEDGSRVFFNSSQPLVARDVNGQQDVYEWERQGIQDCQESSGCVYLLSGGTSLAASWLVDASTSGDDVFINTRAQLLPQDRNDNFDVYDLRVDGTSALAPPACTGTGCQGIPSAPPIFATPASATFAGVGNFAPQSKAPVESKKAKKPTKKHGRHKRKRVKGRGKRKPGRKSNRRGVK